MTCFVGDKVVVMMVLIGCNELVELMDGEEIRWCESEVMDGFERRWWQPKIR